MDFRNLKNILLTGATGVVGARIVCEILTSTQANVFCLLRGKEIDQVKQRLARLVQVYDPNNELVELFNTRVIPILGDLTKSRFNLENSKYEQLLKQVDQVFHVAANVSMIGSYNQLAEVNIKGTEEIIDFCLSGGIPLLYTSSYSVMGDKAYEPRFVFKEEHLDVGQKFEFQNYEKTKWEAEKCIQEAGKRGLQWVTVRLGDVLGDSETACYPITQTTNRSIYYEIIKSITDTGIFYFGYDPLYLTPVNYVAKACIYLACHPEANQNTFHLCNPDFKLMYGFANLLIEFGYKVRFFPLTEFLTLYRSNCVEKYGKPYSSSFTNLMLFLEYVVGLDRLLSDAGLETVQIDTSKAKKFLDQANIICPLVNQDLMSKYLNYCIEHNFIDSPSKQTFAIIKKP